MSRVQVKSKYHAEFKRFSIKDDFNFKQFEDKLIKHHNLDDIPFLIFYTDPIHGDLLPINNDENFAKSISVQQSVFKILVQAKGESYNGLNDFNKKRNFFDNLNSLLTNTATKTPKLEINLMEDFHQVSSIIDADKLPKTCRRVKITKRGSDKPLGFYIRDGISFRATGQGIQKVDSIFISRVLPGGLAESTCLLAVGDEVLEVNGIDILGKTMDQVTDMMVANASNLILTIKPRDQDLKNPLKSTQSNTNSLQRNSYNLQQQQQQQHNLQQQQQLPQLQKQQQPQQQPQQLQQLHSNSTHQLNQQANLQPSNSFLQNSLRSNKSNQPNLLSFQQQQQNSSFNYLKTSSFVSNNQASNYLQENQQININQNLNHFNNSSLRSNLEFFNNCYMKPHNNNYQQQQQQPLQQQTANLSFNLQNQKPFNHQNIYQNLSQFENNKPTVNYNNYDLSLIKNNNSLNNNKNDFGVEDQTYVEDEDDDDDGDEVVNYHQLDKMVVDKLKLRPVY